MQHTSMACHEICLQKGMHCERDLSQSHVTEKGTCVSINDKQCGIPYEDKNTGKKAKPIQICIYNKTILFKHPVLQTDISFLSPKPQARGKYFCSTTDMSQTNNGFKLLNFTDFFF